MIDKIVNPDINLELEKEISRSLLNHLHEGIYFVDLNRQIKFWNKGAEEITGYSKNEIIGKFCHDNILNHKNEDGVELCKNLCPLLTAIRYDTYIDARVYLKHKNGHRVPVWVHISPIKDVNDSIIGAVEIFYDDTSYEKLKTANKNLEIINEQKNELLGMVAHDLRNPLTVALSFSNILLEFHKNKLPKDILEIISKIQKSCNNMLFLINDLLDISAIESGKISLQKSFNSLETLLNLDNFSVKTLAKEKNIELLSDIPNNLPEIFVDSNRISQVIENLLSNAVKFSFPNTKILLQASRNKDILTISVSDQGQGIPENELQNLFKPFVKTATKPTGKEKSNGLGLSIVKKIVELHNGTVTVSSKQGQGSTFYVNLPL